MPLQLPMNAAVDDCSADLRLRPPRRTGHWVTIVVRNVRDLVASGICNMLAVHPPFQHSWNIQVPFSSWTLIDDSCAKYLSLSCFQDTQYDLCWLFQLCPLSPTLTEYTVPFSGTLGLDGCAKYLGLSYFQDT